MLSAQHDVWVPVHVEESLLRGRNVANADAGMSRLTRLAKICPEDSDQACALALRCYESCPNGMKSEHNQSREFRTVLTGLLSSIGLCLKLQEVYAHTHANTNSWDQFNIQVSLVSSKCPAKLNQSSPNKAVERL